MSLRPWRPRPKAALGPLFAGTEWPDIDIGVLLDPLAGTALAGGAGSLETRGHTAAPGADGGAWLGSAADRATSWPGVAAGRCPAALPARPGAARTASRGDQVAPRAWAGRDDRASADTAAIGARERRVDRVEHDKVDARGDGARGRGAFSPLARRVGLSAPAAGEVGRSGGAGGPGGGNGRLGGDDFGDGRAGGHRSERGGGDAWTGRAASGDVLAKQRAAFSPLSGPRAVADAVAAPRGAGRAAAMIAPAERPSRGATPTPRRAAPARDRSGVAFDGAALLARTDGPRPSSRGAEPSTPRRLDPDPLSARAIAPSAAPDVALQRLTRAVERALERLGEAPAAEVDWLEDDDELAGRLGRVLSRQARAQGIGLT